MAVTRLTPLELAAGFPMPGAPVPPSAPADPVEPLEALRVAVRRALERPPCLVSFSGGRDSSAILTLACEVARAEGLRQPVPATARFPASAEADESAWQEEVVCGLGLEDWHRVEAGAEFDCIGPVAASVLRSHGVLWPPNSHFHEPLLATAAGGALLTGIGGDELLGPSQWTRARSVLAGRARPELRDAARIAVALAPPAVRGAALRRVQQPELPWLRPAARGEVVGLLRSEAATEPFAWSRRFRWLAALRYVRLGTESLAVLARAHDVRLEHPFLDPAFVDSLAALSRRRRFDDRGTALDIVFGRRLPVRARQDKAEFGSVLWGERSRALAAAWQGEGVRLGGRRRACITRALAPGSRRAAHAAAVDLARPAVRGRRARRRPRAWGRGRPTCADV